jgi:hypothetical protein
MVRYGSFKYKVVKRLYTRAMTFRDEAETPEKREAWNDVVSWLESFYGPENRCLSKTGAICLTIKNSDVDKMPMSPIEIMGQMR